MSLPLPVTPAFLGTSLLGLGMFRLLAPQSAYKLFALGLTYVLLGLRGNKSGVEALLVGTVVAAQVDAFTVFVYGGNEYGGWRGKWIGHSLGGIVMGIIAWNGWGLPKRENIRYVELVRPK